MITVSNDNAVRVDRAIETVLVKSLRHLEKAGELLNDTGSVDSELLDEAADAVLVAIRKLDLYLGDESRPLFRESDYVGK